MTLQTFDAIIVGAGAAGLMCGIAASQRGRRVLLVEHNDQPGRKILISGGGRCNFTNKAVSAADFLSNNLHFAKSALARYQPGDFIALIEKHKIAYHEKKLGQLFCDRQASDVVEMLLREYRGELKTSCAISEIRHTPEFLVETSKGTFSAPALVIASGGLSIAKMGATSLAYEIAKQFQLKIIPTRPALVPLTFTRADLGKFGSLAGVSTEVIARAGSRRFGEKLLFTHRGLSGPAILQISSYWDGKSSLEIDLLPGVDIGGELESRKRLGERVQLKTVVGTYLPQRFCEAWFAHQADSGALDQLAVKDLRAVAQGLQQWRVQPAGTEGFDKAEVTAGGVDTGGLSSQTMEAKNVPGLYFVGEAVDVTGHLGGYNFQWAWASGQAAGNAI